MGMNLRSCCHLCKEKTFHFRRRENETLLPFYQRHDVCMRLNPSNVETKEDQMQEEDWMADDSEYLELAHPTNLDVWIKGEERK